MGLPGLANVLGIGAALLYWRLDPREKKESLLDAKKKILKGPDTNDRAARLATIDDELHKVERRIERRAS